MRREAPHKLYLANLSSESSVRGSASHFARQLYIREKTSPRCHPLVQRHPSRAVTFYLYK